MNKKQIVQQVLEQNELARGDDIEMYCHSGVVAGKISKMEKVLLRRVMKKIGTPESYRRARQYIQAENPRLKPDTETEAMRSDRADIMRETKGDVDRTDRELFIS